MFLHIRVDWCNASKAFLADNFRVPPFPMRLFIQLALLAIVPTASPLPLFATDESVDFGREVRPILAQHCFKCHGPDPETREAGLRLDEEDAATADLGGYSAIDPGDPESSELMIRVLSDDDELRMPPSDSAPALSEKEVSTLRKWISEGGHYELHWAFKQASSPPLPDVDATAWCNDPLDRFVLRRMEKNELSPSPRASRQSLIRRVFLDLTGTTPHPDEVEDFVSDNAPDAYQRLVDRLLASPDYAERFARPWLDLARYSDTNGYEKDRSRIIWPYRDWVIEAIGLDMPFDQFSVEQLAGDMLPNANNRQRIATGFHRNTMMNEEGGIDPMEYRFYALVDRVATTGTVWMGLTIGCAQCHTHKYDPITHTDYYALLAMLNNADEPDVIVEDLQVQQETERIEADIFRAEQQLIDQLLPSYEMFLRHEDADSSHDKGIQQPQSTVAKAFQSWFRTQVSESRSWKHLRPATMQSTMPKLSVLDDDSILASGDVTKREVYRIAYQLDDSNEPLTALRLEVLPHDSLPANGPGLAFYEGRRGDFFLSELKVSVDGEPVSLATPSHSFGKISVGSGSADANNVIDGQGSTGWSTAGSEGSPNQWVANFSQPIRGPAKLEVELLFERHFAAGLGRFRFSVTTGSTPVTASSLPGALYDWHLADRSELTRSDFASMQRAFLQTSDLVADQRKPIERLRRSIPPQLRSLGFRERSREDYRTTHRHHRGEYLQPREAVEPGVPSIFPGFDEAGEADRLSLARWLVSENNPLAARVTANRAWREFFGTGLVDTAGDFGTQSAPPSHPQLLDWLAVDLRSHDWSLKHLHRRIVLSSTYQQALGAPDQRDPRNRLLAVFPHRRMNAEQIRDTFLSASGLLSRRIGGASVYPPQPAVVNEMAYGAPKWRTSTGSDRYRRSLYTFSKRTAPFAAFTAFDGPTGETCLARRDRSTTPLQALTLLNDEMYLEIARGLANAAIRDLPDDAPPHAIAKRIFRRLLTRSPEPAEIDAILRFHANRVDDPEAWMLVARALMNTDEAITTP